GVRARHELQPARRPGADRDAVRVRDLQRPAAFPRLSASGPTRAAAFGRLIRVSLFPTAVADVLAGLLVGGGGAFPGVGATSALVGASLLVYHGGLALNDWADREHDARTRPDRPLPSRAIPARAVPWAVA